MTQQYYYPFFNRQYTTHVYDSPAFYCYSCTNNPDIANSRGKFSEATEDCGFSNDFRPSSTRIKREVCFTYCMVLYNLHLILKKT